MAIAAPGAGDAGPGQERVEHRSRVFPGGIHGGPGPGRDDLPLRDCLFATTLRLDDAQTAAAGTDLGVSTESAEHLEVGFLHDDATAIAQILAPGGADSGPCPELLQHVLVRCAAGEWLSVTDWGAP